MGGGTTFTVYLPITSKRQTDHPYESEALPPHAEWILFVDDEALIDRMIGRFFEHLEYSVTTRTSIAEALELFRFKPVYSDPVITDLAKPNMTGYKLVSERMPIRLDLPGILCTGFGYKR